jgi:hypothetical protein
MGGVVHQPAPLSKARVIERSLMDKSFCFFFQKEALFFEKKETKNF